MSAKRPLSKALLLSTPWTCARQSCALRYKSTPPGSCQQYAFVHVGMKLRLPHCSKMQAASPCNSTGPVAPILSASSKVEAPFTWSASTNAALVMVQEVVRQLPTSAHYRSMLSKQWTDCTYLDVSPIHEKLTDDDRRQFNQTAMEHAKEVPCRLNSKLLCTIHAACCACCYNVRFEVWTSHSGQSAICNTRCGTLCWAI